MRTVRLRQRASGDPGEGSASYLLSRTPPGPNHFLALSRIHRKRRARTRLRPLPMCRTFPGSSRAMQWPFLLIARAMARSLVKWRQGPWRSQNSRRIIPGLNEK